MPNNVYTMPHIFGTMPHIFGPMPHNFLSMLCVIPISSNFLLFLATKFFLHLSLKKIRESVYPSFACFFVLLTPVYLYNQTKIHWVGPKADLISIVLMSVCLFALSCRIQTAWTRDFWSKSLTLKL